MRTRYQLTKDEHRRLLAACQPFQPAEVSTIWAEVANRVGCSAESICVTGEVRAFLAEPLPAGAAA